MNRSFHIARTLLIAAFTSLLILISSPSSQRADEALSAVQGIPLPARHSLPFIPRPLRAILADLAMAGQMSRTGATLRSGRPLPVKPWTEAWIRLARLAPWNGEIPLFAAHLLMTAHPASALEILDAAMQDRPRDWRLPELKGFILYHQQEQVRQAAFWYEQASRLPEHPPFTASLAGTFYREGGRRQDAIRVLRAFLASCRDPRLLALFRRSLAQMEAGGGHSLPVPPESGPDRNRDGEGPQPAP